MENTMWVLFRGEHVSGIYTSYRRAIHAMMMRAAMPIYSFESDMGWDTFQDGNEDNWLIEEFEADKI